MDEHDSGELMFEGLVRKFLYYPIRLDVDAPLPLEARDAEEVWIRTPFNDTIHGLYWEAQPKRPTLLYLHGNAQSVFDWCLVREELEALDCGLLLIDYPGYGKSTGLPSEKALYASGEAAYNWLKVAQHLDDSSIFVLGKSLGGGVATEICRTRKPLGLILESTFRSIPHVIRQLVPVLPQNSLLKEERYESIDKLADISCPILIIHGDRDELIPLDEGLKLHAAAREPKQLWVVPNAGHNDVSLFAGSEYGVRLRAWLDSLKQTSNQS
jgi:fermentation-respiration switch protein FrsA (DUF1100 family)